MTSARRLYRVHLAFGALGLAAALASAVVAFGAFSLSPPPAGTLARACRSWLPSLAVPELLVLILGASAAVVFALALRSLWRQLTSSRRYLRAFRLSPKPVVVAGERCRAVESPSPLAFCAGYLRPRVYLSSGSIEVLRQDELDAVVVHEAYHARRFDPLRLLLGRALADALFFIPALRRMSERYASLCELAADHAAVAARGSGPSLASALLRFEEHATEELPIGISPERVDSLLGDHSAGRWRIEPRVVVVSALGAASLLAAALISQSTESETVNVPLLVTQSCMLSMFLVPVLLTFSAFALVRRARRA